MDKIEVQPERVKITNGSNVYLVKEDDFLNKPIDREGNTYQDLGFYVVSRISGGQEWPYEGEYGRPVYVGPVDEETGKDVADDFPTSGSPKDSHSALIVDGDGMPLPRPPGYREAMQATTSPPEPQA